jgi:hypothetical protein
MDNSRVLLDTAANGFARISTFSYSRRMRLALLLTFRYGFWRWGPWIPPITDDAIYPDFIRGAKRILAGWDNWFGYDFLADNAETDIFLRRFFEKHCR